MDVEEAEEEEDAVDIFTYFYLEVGVYAAGLARLNRTAAGCCKAIGTGDSRCSCH